MISDIEHFVDTYKDIYNNDELYLKLIKKYYNETNNSIFIINFVIYDKLKYNPINCQKPEVLTLAKERLGQTEFRRNIINRDTVCIVSGDDVDICEACHIIPYSESKSYNINNGILLNRILHDVFDKYDLTINDNKVILSNKILNKNTYKNIHIYHNKHINVPKECIDNLKQHYNKFIKKYS